MNETSEEHVRNILVVDDEPEINNVVVAYLTDVGYLCHAVSSAEAGLVVVGSHAFDCILLDVNMPGQSGLEMLKTLGQKHSKIPVVMMTARDDPDTAMEALGGGAYAYITKPFSRKKLLMTMLQVFDNHDPELKNRKVGK